VRYVVSINGKRLVVEREGGEIIVEGRRIPAALEEIDGTPLRLVRLGDDVHRVVVRSRRGRGEYVLWLDGYSYDVEALDERARAIRDLSAATAAPAGPAPLIAPMPGLVVRVLVEAGQAVSAGQGLVVMEAMKMENELRATASGTVKSVRTSAGSAVEKGAVLVELE
jgi:biotin carboxyl carrier protein